MSRKLLIATTVFLLPVLLSFSVLSILFPKASSRIENKTSTSSKGKHKQIIYFTAVGDSLTKGLGDSTNSGGYIPILAKSLTDEYQLNAVQTDNFGVIGNRSDQILKRIKKDQELQNSLKKATVIALTVGGNDLMKVAQKEFMNNITEETFVKPRENYQEELKKIYSEIRKLNPSAPIYQFGVYNPYYYEFGYITELQEIVNNWNDASQEIVDNERAAYFIPINDLLYKGSQGESGIGNNADRTDEVSSSSDTSTKEENDLIYEKDRFHPNNIGYQLMAKALKEKMITTANLWLSK